MDYLVLSKRTTIIEVKENPTNEEAVEIPPGEMVYTPIGDGDTSNGNVVLMSIH